MRNRNKNRVLVWIISLYTMSCMIFAVVMMNQADYSISETDLGIMCLASVYSAGSVSAAETDDEDDNETEAEKSENTVTTAEVKKTVKKQTEKDLGDDPVVLIVHTHATETYLPSTEGNYHSKTLENSVRDVGQVLAETLEEEGVPVIHDKTLHDDPSYNNSYYRSAETVIALLEKYPSIKCVIDLHRDAIASSAAGATVSIQGKTCAKYMYVVGTTASTYQSNLSFINSLNDIAASEYSGFTGTVLERGYGYNQSLSSKYLLLEIGNNRNDIQDARNTAEVVGKIIAAGLKK